MRLSTAGSAAWITLAALVGGCAWDSDPELNRRYVRAPWSDAGRRAPDRTGSQSPVDADAPRELPEQADLSDYLRYAALNNQAMEAAFARWKAAMERIPQVKALPDPRLDYRYFIVRMGAGPGMEQRQGMALSQMFPWFGKLQLRGDAAAEAANAEWQQFQAARLALAYQVKDAYYEHWYVERSVAVTRENIELLNYIEKTLQARYAAAAVGHPDVIRVQVEQGRLADRLRTLQRLRQPVAARLNAAMNRPSRAALTPPKEIEERVADASDEQLRAWLTESNPRLAALDHQIARQKHMVDLAKKEYFPDVMLGVEWMDMTMMPGMAGGSRDNWATMLSLNLPIWYDKLAAGVREARWQRLEAASRKADLANTLSSDLEMALYRYQDATYKIDLYQEALLPKAVQAQQATDAAFRAGRATFNDLIDTQRVLLEFQLALSRARADRAQRLAEIEMLVGREVSAPAGNQRPPAIVQNNERSRTEPATQPDDE